MTLAEALAAAVAHHNAGRLVDAENIYRQILAFDPTNADANHLLGCVEHQLGRHESAIEHIQRALHVNGNSATFYHHLGDAQRALKRHADAVISYRRALALKPDLVESLNNLGLALCEQGNFGEAIACYRQALNFAPTDVDLLLNLGSTLRNDDKPAEAVSTYEAAIAAKPDCASAHFCLGNIWATQEQFESAAQYYRLALQHDPNFADAHINLGRVLVELGQLPAAGDSFRRALTLRPEDVAIYNRLGQVLMRLGDLGQAEHVFRRALEIAPQHAETFLNLGQCLRALWRVPESWHCFDQAFAYATSAGVKIRAATYLPRILQSGDEIEIWRERLKNNLNALMKEPLTLMEPATEIGGTNFLMAYHGENGRPLQEQIAALYARACPALQYVAPHCQTPRAAGGPIRIGFISNFFQDHSVTRHFAGVWRHLKRDTFRVILLGFGESTKSFANYLEGSADEVVTLTRAMKQNLRLLQETVAAQKLDVLFYTDIGMDQWTYFLAFARLAPVQLVVPGHPITTGIPTVDFFISFIEGEPPGALEHYTERLICLREILNYFQRPTLTGPTKTRRDFGLDPDAHIYLCAQALFKIHADFDELAAGILHGDPKGRLVLVQDRQPGNAELVMERICRTRPDLREQIQFVPRQAYDDYLWLLSLADAILDTPHFNGGTTTFQTLGLGMPIVTLPGKFLRGRVTMAAYRQISVEDCIAMDADDYVRIALRLANDPKWREEVRARILAGSVALYENGRVVRELEDFLIQASTASVHRSL